MSDGATSVGSIRGEMDLGLEQWIRAVARVKADVDEMKALRADIKVNASTTVAEEQLAVVDAAADSIDRRRVTVKVETTGADKVAAAEAKVSAAITASETATARAQIAEMRLNELRERGARTASQLAAAELAASVAIGRSEAAAAKAAAAEDALAASQAAAAATAVEEAGAKEAVDTATKSSNGSIFSSISANKAQAVAIAALIVAIAPLTAAAVGLAGAFVLEGAAGVAAVVGIKSEMDKGTQTGEAYRSGLANIKSEFADLSTTAATAMLSEFEATEQRIAQAMPELNAEVGVFAGYLGRTGGTLVDAVLSALPILNPLFQQAAQYVERIAGGLQGWVSGGGLQDFADYAQQTLPRVEGLIDATASAAVDLGTALSDDGDSLITVLTQVMKTIDNISSLANAVDDLKSKSAGLSALSKAFDIFNPLAYASGIIKNLGYAWDGLTGKQVNAAQYYKDTTGMTLKVADASDVAAAAVTRQKDAMEQVAARYGMTASAYKTATDAANKQASSSSAATQAMQAEGDAAGLLKESLDLLNGKVLGVAEAQTGFAAANNTAAKTLKDSKGAIDGNSEAAVSSQQAIQSAAEAAQRLAQAQATATGSTAAGTKSLQDSKKALEDNLRATGSLTPAVQAYINKIYQIPKTAPTTAELDKAKADADLTAYRAKIAGIPALRRTAVSADTAAANRAIKELVANIANIPGYKAVVIDQQIRQTGAAAGAVKAAYNSHGGTAQRFATGGTSGSVWGSAGSATSDKIKTYLSIGEEVTSSSAAGYPGVRPVLKAINADPAGTMAALRAPQTDSGDVKVYVTNKSGAAIEDLIEVVIERHGRRKAVDLSTGLQKAV